MPVYHQMGHQSENLVFEPALSNYSGSILSPVNQGEAEVVNFIQRARDELDEFEIIFDPQLYYPQTNRGQISNWDYFPNDVDTADPSNYSWWRGVLSDLCQNLERLDVDKVCSPVNHPRVFSDEYYEFTNQLTADLKTSLENTNIRVLKTAFVSLADIAIYERVMRLASILSRDSADGIYLILYSDMNPRRELSQAEELKGALLLISLLEQSNVDVLVGYSSSEMALWKAVGANSCATGKFFNLRKFTPSRWADAEEGGGGGQLPYLFEESLFAYLRESDIPRIQDAGRLSVQTQNNPYFPEIRESINTGAAWLALSWRFYLYAFCNIERRIQDGGMVIPNLLREADENWAQLDEDNIFMEERQNNGEWLRNWLRAIAEYQKPWRETPL